MPDALSKGEKEEIVRSPPIKKGTGLVCTLSLFKPNFQPRIIPVLQLMPIPVYPQPTN